MLGAPLAGVLFPCGCPPWDTPSPARGDSSRWRDHGGRWESQRGYLDAEIAAVELYCALLQQS